MRENVQWVRVGLGLAGMGYGMYRLYQGRRDWLSTAVTTVGFSMALSGITNQPIRPTANLMYQLTTRPDVRLAEAVVAALS